LLRLGYAEDDSLVKDTPPSSNTDTKTDSPNGKVLDVDGNPQKPGHDLDGRPLPRGAVARLGSRRLRHEGWYKRIWMLPDSKTIISTAPGKGVHLWNADTGKLLREIDLQGESFSAMDLSHDGKFLVTLSAKRHFEKREKTRTLRLWDTTTWQVRPVATWVGSMSDDKCVAISPDAKIIALSKDRYSIIFWDVESGKKLLDKKVAKHAIESIAFSPDGELVAIAERDKTLLWKWDSGEEPKALKPLVKRTQIVVFSPDGRLLATGSRDDFAARLWDVKSGKLLRRLKGKAERYYREGLKFSSDGKSLIVPANSTKAVENFDVASGRLRQSIDTGGLESRDAAVSSDGRLLASIGSNAAIKLWAMPEGKCLSDRFTGNADDPYQVAFTPDGRNIVTGCDVGTIRVWDADTGQQQRLMNCRGWVNDLAVSADGKKIASCSHDNTVRLWDLESGREIYNLPGHGRLGGNNDYTIDFDRSGARLLSFGLDFYLRVWSTQTGKALAEHAIRPSGIKLEEMEDGTLRVAGEAEEDPFGRDGIIGVIKQAMFNADATQFFLGDEKSIYVFDVESGREIDKFKLEDSLSTFHVSPDGGKLITLEHRRLKPDPKATGLQAKRPGILYFLRILQLPSKQKVRQIELPGRGGYTMAFSSDNRLVAVEIHVRKPDKPTRRWIGVWDLEMGNEVACVDAYDRSVSSLAFSPDGRRLASSHRDTTVLVWDLDKFKVDGAKQD
ncbi:MAG: WD40 repeat domain-containing protein, partial [Planctomycetota bacterium]|nr:WD40 repeat domain-containing protein [Planctomycetota bacterium]